MVVKPEADPLRRRKIAYRGIARGVFFICIGVILLLNMSGRLGWGVWWDLLRMWPVLLVSLGIRLIFVNTRAHLLSLLGPALVAGTAIWVAVAWEGDGSFAWSRDQEERTEAIRCPQGTGGESPARTAAAGLDVEFAAGRLDLRVDAALSGAGFSGTLRHSAEPASWDCRNGDLRLRRRGESGRFRFFAPFGESGARWEGQITSAAPVDFRAELAASIAEIDLRSAPLLRADISPSASRLLLRLGTPRGRVPIRLDGALSDVHLIVPEGTCVDVSGDWALNVLDIEGHGRRRWRSRSAASGACDKIGSEGPRYDVRYELPLSSIKVDTEPAAL